MKNTTHHRQFPKRERGISLITVLILLLLSLTAVLGAFRVANLNEAMLGNTSDFNRAQAAAEALLRDAEMDIRGRRPPYTTIQPAPSLAPGWPCRPTPANDLTSNVTETGYVGCRNQATANTPWFPRNNEDFDSVTDIVVANSGTYRCKQGICMPANTTTLDHIENNLATMTPFGATYGQYTRNSLTALDAASNPILSSATARAWYWVEGFRYSQATPSGANIAADLVPDAQAPFVYRITVVAQGMKAGTQVVIKSMFVPYPAKQNI